LDVHVTISGATSRFLSALGRKSVFPMTIRRDLLRMARQRNGPGDLDVLLLGDDGTEPVEEPAGDDGPGDPFSDPSSDPSSGPSSDPFSDPLDAADGTSLVKSGRVESESSDPGGESSDGEEGGGHGDGDGDGDGDDDDDDDDDERLAERALYWIERIARDPRSTGLLDVPQECRLMCSLATRGVRRGEARRGAYARVAEGDDPVNAAVGRFVEDVSAGSGTGTMIVSHGRPETRAAKVAIVAGIQALETGAQARSEPLVLVVVPNASVAREVALEATRAGHGLGAGETQDTASPWLPDAVDAGRGRVDIVYRTHGRREGAMRVSFCAPEAVDTAGPRVDALVLVEPLLWEERWGKLSPATMFRASGEVIRIIVTTGVPRPLESLTEAVFGPGAGAGNGNGTPQHVLCDDVGQAEVDVVVLSGSDVPSEIASVCVATPPGTAIVAASPAISRALEAEGVEHVLIDALGGIEDVYAALAASPRGCVLAGAPPRAHRYLLPHARAVCSSVTCAVDAAGERAIAQDLREDGEASEEACQRADARFLGALRAAATPGEIHLGLAESVAKANGDVEGLVDLQTGAYDAPLRAWGRDPEEVRVAASRVVGMRLAFVS